MDDATGGNSASIPASPAPKERDPSPYPQLTLTPRLQGDEIRVDVSGEAPLYYQTCSHEPRLRKLEGDRFVELRDDRTGLGLNSSGYYLDGRFVPPGVSYGCDTIACIPLPAAESLAIGRAEEWVKTGQAAAPAGTSSPDGSEDPQLVDVFAAKPLSGVVQIAVDFFKDADCTKLTGVTFQFTIPTPEQGVCCDVNAAECSSEGPAGGWAPSLDACAPWEFTDSNVVLEKRIDPRGCPKLVYDSETCCGCSDEDAGI